MRLVIVILLLFASASLAEPVVWKFEVGQETPYRIVQDMTMAMDAGASGQVNTTTSQTVDMTWVVEQVNDDGSARVRHDVTRVQMSMTAQLGQGYQFDTASPDPPEGLATLLAPVFEQLVESDYTVTVTPRGEITDLVAPAELLEAIKNMPGGGSEAANMQAIEFIARHVAVLLPEESLEPGMTWSTATESVDAMFGKQRVQTTYEYAGSRDVDGRTVEVFTPQINLTSIPGAAVGPVIATLNSGDTSGEVLFDRAAGLLVESNVQTTTDIEIKANEQTITGAMQQTTTVTFGVAEESEADNEPTTAE